MRVYLDAAPVIYAIERISPYMTVVAARLAVPNDVLIASELTRMECRVKPLRLGDKVVLNDYDKFFSTAVDEMVELSRAVVERATEIRARHGFKTPDALHLAAAVTSKCDAFLTNDHRLDRFPDIVVEVL